MSPDRKKIVNGVTVTEYYWAGEMAVYIGNRASGMTFDGAVKMLEEQASQACIRCNDERVIRVEDRPHPNDVSPTTHEEPCPECAS